ncbi:hypothetical protein INH39_15930 [Massilia violaceinigra]|uniref:HTH-type transcriptional regulator AraC-type N-terminal domain-containing protein n=1 Tax=Massilia violaceinigra TaxID=2045208 RepID=A0ABY4ADV9_9BURK|nr:hypothetical protein [Massilia violaceinigra]UOD32987.1 hypothetical protein INH39_15930 [Massilia violaceinigra]
MHPRKSAAIDPLVHCSVAELMRMYIEEGLVTRPEMLGLPDFSSATLIEHGFDPAGDVEYRLYEKSYRFACRAIELNFKVYIENGVIDSNGVELGGKLRVETELHRLATLLAPGAIRSIELLIFDNLLVATLLINDTVNINIHRYGKKQGRSKFSIGAISTDASFRPESAAKKFNTGFSRKLCDETVSPNPSRRHARNPALRNLSACLIRLFGSAYREGRLIPARESA